MWWLLWTIFVFVAGAFASLFVVWKIMVIAEQNAAALRLAALNKAAHDGHEAYTLASHAPGGVSAERKGWAKLQTPKESTNGVNKSSKWSYLVLKANMLFWYKDEKENTSPSAIICLDNCQVALRRWKRKPRFHPKTALEITNDQRSLVQYEKTIMLYFQTGRDLEGWLHAIRHAVSLKSTPNAKQHNHQILQNQFFGYISRSLRQPTPLREAEWFNALLGRVFWGIHDAPFLLQFLEKKLNHKLGKVKKPKIVEDIRVTKIRLGPYLPLVSNIVLLESSPTGELRADADIDYRPEGNAGFHIEIEILLHLQIPGVGVSYHCPFVLGVSVNRLRGRLHFYCSSPPAKKFWIGFYQEPDIQLTVDTVIGKDKKVKNLPKLADIIVYKLKAEAVELLVLPNMDDWPIPRVPAADGEHDSSSDEDEPHPSADSTASHAADDTEHEVDLEAFVADEADHRRALPRQQPLGEARRPAVMPAAASKKAV